VWGSEPPAVTVAYEEPMGDWDSGSSVLFDDAPTSEDLDALPRDTHPHDVQGLEVVCLHCLINDHPEIGRGMDIARAAFSGGDEAGVAGVGDDGEWGLAD
jgi:hypothetical protein